MVIAILGASGAVGGALAAQLLERELLVAGDRLILAGHAVSTTQNRLFSERMDLLDAFSDPGVAIDVVDHYRDVEADVVLVAAGATVSPEHPTRRDLALVNRPLFEDIAEHCIGPHPHAKFVVIANPVELAVDIFSSATAPRNVIGMGAQLDSRRFARALADELRMPRADVRASVVGEHGQAMVPLWSTVELRGASVDALACFARCKQNALSVGLGTRVELLRDEVAACLRAENVAEAYAATHRALPDARIAVEPFITAHVQHSTPHATAAATLDLVVALRKNDGRVVHGQVRMAGETLSLAGVFGIPLRLQWDGWHAVPFPELDALESESIRASASAIAATLALSARERAVTM